nr:glycosyltransferase [Saprospiraceae bacterium]
MGIIVDVIIPVYNEEDSIGKVISEIPDTMVRHVVVCNNGSKDGTAAVAESHGAIVVHQPEKGYGNACLKGMEYI